MDWTLDNLRPEEREKLEVSLMHPGMFYSLIVEPPVKTEPYTPPDEDIPPSSYIPLALRMPPMPKDNDEWMKMRGRFGPRG
jgi:hypothetical protein